METTADAPSRPTSVAARFGPSTWPRPARTRGGRLLNVAIVTIAVAGALAGLFITWYHLVHDPLADVHAYFEASSRLNAGQLLYPPDIDPATNHAYLYPPLLAVALRPVASMGFEAFAVVWETVIVGSFVLLVRRLGANRWTWLALGTLAMPIGWCLVIGQAQIPMTLLLSLGQPWSIALAANLKLFPALIVLWWLGRRDLRSTAMFAGWAALLVLLQLVLEPAGTLAYLPSLSLAGIGDLLNISPYALSPWLWAALVVVGCVLAVRSARTRWGWPIAVALATLASPRLLTYMLMGLLAALREPGRGRPIPSNVQPRSD